jgi:hypothetical protein
MYIVALSANTVECNHADACAVVGLDGFLAKPLRPDAIAQLWQAACARAAAAPQPHATSGD